MNRQTLRVRAEREAANLSALTGWPIEDVRRKIGTVGEDSSAGRKWWQRLFRE